MSAVKALQTANEHLGKREDRAAVDAILAAWAEVASPEIAELLELAVLRLRRRADWVDPSLSVFRFAEYSSSWVEVANKKEPTFLTELIATAAMGRLGINDRLRALLDYPRDPRLARLAGLFANPPTYLDDEAYAIVAELLQHAGDPRVIDVLRTSIQSRLVYFSQTTRERLEAAFGASGTETYRRTSLDIQEQRLVTEAMGLLDDVARSEVERHAWLERIAADPRDLSTRQVFADWLQEQGDPVGPYLARALSDDSVDADSSPPAVMETDRWLGVLADAVKVVARRNGFPSACIPSRSLAPTIGASAWATLEDVTLSNAVDEDAVLADLILHPVMKSLRSITVNASLAQLLLERAHDAMREWKLRIKDPIPPALLAKLAGVPLEGIAGPITPEDVPVALKLPVRLLEVILKEPVECTLILERPERSGAWTRLTADFVQYVTQTVMLDTFRGIPDKALTSVAVRMAPRYTGRTEARPLPLKQTHGPTLKSRFPQAQTEIRS